MSYLVFTFFQVRSHHDIYDAIFEQDEAAHRDAHRNRVKAKLTLTECIIALAIAITLVTSMALTLVEQIDFVVEERGVSDPFMGLILVPLVEKAAEHLMAINEAWDDQMNFAMPHLLGATLQTALFNGPLVVISAWGPDKALDLSFETFEDVVLILAIVAVGNFLRDGKSNYLEGFLCVIITLPLPLRPPTIRTHRGQRARRARPSTARIELRECFCFIKVTWRSICRS